MSPNSRRQAARGFTLIELLVAAAIAATLAGVAALSFNLGGHDDRLRDEARRVFELGRIAADDAVFKTTEYGVRFTHSDYAFYQLERSTTGSGDTRKVVRRWVPLSEHRLLRSQEWQQGIEVEVYVEGLPVVLDEERDEEAENKDESLKPHLMFLSNGDVMPNVELHLHSEHTEAAWRIGLTEEGVMGLSLLEQ